MRTWLRLLATSSLLAITACGGGDDDGVAPDGATNDGIIPDTSPPAANRGMTLAVTDVRLTSPDAVARGINGGSISLVFTDLATEGGEVVYGTSPVGGCLVTRYDATHAPALTVGAGTITIEAPATGVDGRRKVVGPCDYVPGLGYACHSNDGTNQAVNATDLPNSATSPPGLIAYTFPAQAFPPAPGVDLVGGYLIVDGFDNAAFNAPAGSAFPIVAQNGTTGLIVFNPAGEGAGTETIADGGVFQVLNGFAPAPVGASGDFLGDASSSVRIQKAAHDEWGAIDFTTYVQGEGFDLNDVSAQPHQFPGVAAAVTFDCSGDSGDCGSSGTGALEAFIVSGETTDGDVEGLLDFQMPPPVNQWATFQCAFLLADSGVIAADAVQAILDTNPSRIETRLLRVAGISPSNDENNELNSGAILVGHGIVGHTTLPQ